MHFFSLLILFMIESICFAQEQVSLEAGNILKQA